VDNVAPKPHIPESFFEHRQIFADPWIDRWILPNPFLVALAPILRGVGVELSDYSLNTNAANVGDSWLNISLRKLNATVRIGLDTVTFIAANPYWAMTPLLVPVFDQLSDKIRSVAGASPKFQEATLAFHVTSGTVDFRKMTATLVNKEIAGECLFHGISLHRPDNTVLIIDKSLRYENAAFIRLQRRFSPEVLFAEIVARLYDDEVAALRLLGISGVP
jgi:hypothetical protein